MMVGHSGKHLGNLSQRQLLSIAEHLFSNVMVHVRTLYVSSNIYDESRL